MPLDSVNTYLNQHESDREALSLLRSLILTCDLAEQIKWNIPVYTLGNKNVVGMGAFKDHLALWFFQGALLKDPDRHLINAQEGKTQAMRHWRFNNLTDIQKNQSQIKAYLLEARENQRQGLGIKPRQNLPLATPALLKNAMAADAELTSTFDALSKGKQREYANFILEAKQEATQLRRLDKIIPMIKSGLGLNDQYRRK